MFIIVPQIVELVPGKTYNQTRPKYFSAQGTQADVVAAGTAGVSWGAVDAGESMIVYAVTTPTMDTNLTAMPDVVVVPPLDNVITAGAVNAVQNQIEALNLPAHWVTAGMTYRTVLRVLVGMVQLIQRMDSLGQRVRLTGNLDRTIGSLSAAIQTALTTACDQLGIDHSTIIGTTTVREALRIFGQEFIAGQSISLGPL